MNTKHFPNTGYLYYYISIGILWGLAEFFIGTLLKDIVPGNIAGSVLIGFSLFFLSVSYNLEKSKIMLIIPLLFSILIKLFGTLLIGKQILHPFFINPLLSLILTTILFSATQNLPFAKYKKYGHPITGTLLYGLTIAALSSLLFPLLNYLSGFPMCYKTGTSIPLSVWYLHISAITGAISYYTGIILSEKLVKRYLNHNL